MVTKIQIGKSGITKNIVEEIMKQLKKHKIVDVKFLKSAINGKNKKVLFEEIAAKTNALVVKKIGFVVTLKKKI